ncbi:glyoxal oxidase [Ceratobasidium sp. AG-Ba]|nr:glyoxal oxidase [Ceratobasidium sp. AG-Ba]
MTRSYWFFLAPAVFSLARATWTLDQPGTTGVNAMQLAVMDGNHLVIIDKLESNPLMTNKGTHALGSMYNLKDNTKRPLNGISTNTFCAGGGWLSNGTLVSIGGNPLVESGGTTSPDGLQGDWTNNPNINNPTYEFYPPKNIHGHNGTSIPMQYLVDTMPHNLFPHLICLGKDILMLANNMPTLFNWESNTETRLPILPNHQRVTYPYSGSVVLLPMKPGNGYQPEVLVCGGSQTSETDPTKLSSSTPASAQCSRMVLTPEGIKKGWAVETMPEPRTMHSTVLLPNGKVLIVNGAKSGTAGYGNVQNQVGASNADNPALQPVIYDPDAPAGQRFSSEGLPTSDIPRMYHSTAALLMDGRVFIAGSNPNLDVSTWKYPTEYRVEIFSPPYALSNLRPMLVGLPGVLNFNRPTNLKLQLPKSLQKRGLDLGTCSCFLMDMMFSTHGVEMGQRMVMLSTVSSGPLRLPLDLIPLTIMGPPNTDVFQPGPGMVLVGSVQPPVDEGAIANLLNQIKAPSP